MSPENKVVYFFCFYQFVCILLFCCYLIAVAKTPSSLLNKSGENGHLCLVPRLRGKALRFFFFFTIENNVHCRFFLYIAFIMLRYVLSTFLTAFIMKGCYTLSNKFSMSIEMII